MMEEITCWSCGGKMGTMALGLPRMTRCPFCGAGKWELLRGMVLLAPKGKDWGMLMVGEGLEEPSAPCPAVLSGRVAPLGTLQAEGERES